ncbi:MAG: DUF3781 domain-containing protein [Spirochaetes bacterium]|nr:DUF3781 domain-containing protein [Spirochaetota bacterium]
MAVERKKIIDNICYTELVYRRINKKLGTDYSRSRIETLILDLLKTTPESGFTKKGKNYYIANMDKGIRITVNSYTFRVITADRLSNPDL